MTFDLPASKVLITIPSGGFYAQQWTFGEHSGTHMDAPGHFVEGGRLSPEITLQELIVPIALVAMDSGWSAKVGDPLVQGRRRLPRPSLPRLQPRRRHVARREPRRHRHRRGHDQPRPRQFDHLPRHVNFLATDTYGLENLNNLDRIPPRGAVASVGLIPWENGSGGPCRVIASW